MRSCVRHYNYNYKVEFTSHSPFMRCFSRYPYTRRHMRLLMVVFFLSVMLLRLLLFLKFFSHRLIHMEKPLFCLFGSIFAIFSLYLQLIFFSINARIPVEHNFASLVARHGLVDGSVGDGVYTALAIFSMGCER